MTKQEYLKELDTHLISLPDEEREMAVNFYAEYFEEAGFENEDNVMSELGKPFQLAKSIIGEQSAYSKSEVYIRYRESNPINSGSVFASIKKESTPYTPQTVQNQDSGMEIYPVNNVSEPDIMPSGNTSEPSENFSGRKQNADTSRGTGYNYSNTEYNNTNTGYNSTYANYGNPKKKMSAAMIIFWVFFITFIGVPIIFPLLGALFATLISIFAAAAACAVAGVACIIVGVVLLVVGIARLFTSMMDGIAYLAVGCVAMGVGILILIPSLLFCIKTIPWCFKGIGKIIKKLKGRGKNV